MPFTLSHPAAVLVLKRSGLPLVALVAGAMVPDLPLFVPVPYDYQLSHAPLGIVTVDLLVGGLVTVLWTFLIRGVLLDASPQWLRERLGGAGDIARSGWALLPLALVIGSITHVVWDEFTHQGRWGATHVSWLSDAHLGYAGYHWAQAASSVVGLAITLIYACRGIARRPRRPAPARLPVLARCAMLAVIAAAAVAGAVAGGTTLNQGLHAAAFSAAVHGITALVVALLVAAFVWRAATEWTGSRPSTTTGG